MELLKESIYRPHRAMSEPQRTYLSAKKLSRSVPCPDPLYPFSRTTVETKTVNEEEVAEVVHCILLTSAAGHEILTFDYEQESCTWTCESYNASAEQVKFRVQMFKRKSGTILVEWQRLVGSSTIFFDLYRQCKAALASDGKVRKHDSSKQLHRCRTDSAAVLSGGLCDLHSNLVSIPEEEFHNSRKALEAWMEKDPREAEIAVRKLSLSPQFLRDSLRWIPSAQEV
jgi:hypothetical protein